MNTSATSGLGQAVTTPRRTGFCASFRRWPASTLFLLLLTANVRSQPTPPAPWPSGPALADLSLEIPAPAEDSLRRNPRKYVRATLHANGQRFAEVGVHLKGATGSFRPYDDHPSLTLDLRRFGKDSAFDGVPKLHLNNSVEDPTLLHEWIGSELFRDAGLPVARCAHARLSINGRNRGLYVLKEGFTAETAARLFPGRTGTFFEPVPGSDVDGLFRPMGQANASAQRVEILDQLAQATTLADREKRFAQLTHTVVPSDFASFMALEVILGHRDGYTLARNNYRVFADSNGQRVTWVPHGMDQLFTQPDAPWNPHLSGLVARAWNDTPAGRALYSDRLRTLASTLLASTNIDSRIDRHVDDLAPFLNAAETRRLKNGGRDLKERIAARRTRLGSQLSTPPIPIARFRNGILDLTDWRSDSTIVRTTAGSQSSPSTLRLKADPQSASTWSTRVRLEPGRYRFEGRARTSEVAPLKTGRNQGASLRIRGTGARSEGLRDTRDWTRLQADFDVPAGSDSELVELICELRASRGEAWFETASLRLVRIEPGQ